jgi:hypothetical protein
MDPQCPHAARCEMYDLLQLSGTLATWKINYCSADFTRCARYKLAAENKPVPINLMPNGVRLRTSSGKLKAQR